jgi:hypothetical protein
VEMELEAWAKLLISAAKDGQGALLVSLLLMGLVALLRRVGGRIPKIGPFLQSRIGGWVLVLLSGALGAIATALMAGTAVSMSLVLTGLGVGFAAAGGYQAVKDLLPDILGRLFGSSPKVPEIDVDAAAQQAVAQKPSAGLDGMVSKSGTFGTATPEQIAQFDAEMIAAGYVKQPDGSYRREKPK